MKTYKVHGFQGTLTHGVVRLTGKQAEPRWPALKLVKVIEPHKAAKTPDPKADAAAKAAVEAANAKLVPQLADYEVTGPINFKRLEEFGWEGRATRLQESQQFAEVRQANERIAQQEKERVEKQRLREDSGREVRSPRGSNLR